MILLAAVSSLIFFDVLHQSLLLGTFGLALVCICSSGTLLAAASRPGEQTEQSAIRLKRF